MEWHQQDDEMGSALVVFSHSSNNLATRDRPTDFRLIVESVVALWLVSSSAQLCSGSRPAHPGTWGETCLSVPLGVGSLASRYSSGAWRGSGTSLRPVSTAVWGQPCCPSYVWTWDKPLQASGGSGTCSVSLQTLTYLVLWLHLTEQCDGQPCPARNLGGGICVCATGGRPAHLRSRCGPQSSPVTGFQPPKSRLVLSPQGHAQFPGGSPSRHQRETDNIHTPGDRPVICRPHCGSSTGHCPSASSSDQVSGGRAACLGARQDPRKLKSLFTGPPAVGLSVGWVNQLQSHLTVILEAGSTPQGPTREGLYLLEPVCTV